jgi:hypothetical protein
LCNAHSVLHTGSSFQFFFLAVSIIVISMSGSAFYECLLFLQQNMGTLSIRHTYCVVVLQGLHSLACRVQLVALLLSLHHWPGDFALAGVALWFGRVLHGGAVS